jgi:hypothetical protein
MQSGLAATIWTMRDLPATRIERLELTRISPGAVCRVHQTRSKAG